ncbi:MAG TPA: hypothetical protein VFI14_10520, partial [Chryseosolibacter sp.]|nr:hypothetical protein [Chryseosolibacter sp.]
LHNQLRLCMLAGISFSYVVRISVAKYILPMLVRLECTKNFIFIPRILKEAPETSHLPSILPEYATGMVAS